MTKILLINPHVTEQDGFTNPPLGLLYLAGTLLRGGFDVMVVDGCREGKDAINKALISYQPHIVGITCLTPGRKRALEIVALVKSLNRNTMAVLGGAHPTIMYRQLLEQYPDIDVVVLGEGEQTMLAIAQGMSFEQIDGIAYRDRAGKIVRTQPRTYVQNLDEIPFPAWDLLDLHSYPGWGEGKHNGIVLRDHPRISVVFSRGCSGHCDFCSTWWVWQGWRRRSPGNMADELELLYREFGIRHFCFADDAMTVDRQATIELCDEIIGRDLRIAFHVTTRTDCVDEEVLRKLQQAGCYTVAFGIETGSPRLLAAMGKENNVENSVRAISLCRKIGLAVTALLIVGNVGENEESVLETLDLLKRAQPDEVGCTGALWVLPGTKLYQECRRRGVIDDSFWLGDDPYMLYTMEHSLETLEDYVRIIKGYKGCLRRTVGMVKRLPKILRKLARLRQ